MKSTIKKIFITTLAACLMITSSGVSMLSVSAAKTMEQLQSDAAAINAELKRLKQDAKNKKAVLETLQKKIANTQAQIQSCNSKISKINSKINANKTEINKKNAEIEKNKLEFKKRLRAIYMSNTGSDIQILLGADDFSEFLQLSQMTAAISARDKRLIENLVSAIKELEAINAENNRLLEEQVSIRKSIEATQSQLKSEEDQAEKLYKEVNSDIKDAEAIKADIEDDIENLNKTFSGGGGSFVNSVVGFSWPVPSHSGISSYFGYRIHPISGKKKYHYGIDISGGSIYNKPIVAITDGVIEKTYTSCPHKSKRPSCTCGSGYGNYVAVDHGLVQGNAIYAMYAHMDHLASGMTPGAKVTKGQVLGYVGTTGTSTGYHLHFGIKKNGAWVNPLNYFTVVK